jgi:hypothetical protein
MSIAAVMQRSDFTALSVTEIPEPNVLLPLLEDIDGVIQPEFIAVAGFQRLPTRSEDRGILDSAGNFESAFSV